MKTQFKRKAVLVTATALLSLLVLIGIRSSNVSISEAHAQSRSSCGGYISYGQTVFGSIPYAGQACFYRFTGRANDRVTIRMTKNSYRLDPYLKLLAPNGYAENWDDDSGSNGNSLISYHRLARSGTYTIMAGSYRNQTSGSFSLTLSRNR
jgi:hypothetical protein